LLTIRHNTDIVGQMDDIKKMIEQARKAGKRPAFSYDRVSTQEQADTGSSLQYQADAGQRYADANGLFIVHHFSAAESGFKEGRKEFNDMLTLSEKHGINDLIFKNADRLGRNQIDHQRLKKYRKEKEYVIHFYESATVLDKDSTAEHELFSHNMAGFAEYWSNKISQGVKAANKYKAQRGTPAGRPPFGYVFDYEEKLFKIDPEKKKILHKIFKEYDYNGLSIQAICDKLNAAGHTSPRGRKWQKAHLHYILSNSIYAGYFFDKDGKEHNANHEAYFTRAQFEERQYKMRKSFRGTRKRDTNYLFSGLLRYEKTGRMLTGEMHKGHVYYGHRNPNVMFSQMQIIISIIAAITQLQAWGKERKNKFDNDVSGNIRRIIDEITTDKRPMKKSLEQRIGNLKAEEKRLLKLFSQNAISKDSLLESIEEIKGERNECEDKLRKIDNYDFTRADEFKKNVNVFFETNYTAEENIASIREIVDHIIIPEYVKDHVAYDDKGIIDELDNNSGPGEPLSIEKTADVVKPFAAKIVFKRQYRPLFDYITEVRNRKVMLPELTELRTILIETLAEMAG